MKMADLFFVAVTSLNVDCSLVFEELYRIAEIMKQFFGDKLSEEAIKEYLVLTYELLDGKQQLNLSYSKK